MKFFIDKPMLKSEHYKQSIPWFSLETVVVGAYYDADIQRKIHRFKFVHNHVDSVYFARIFSSMKEEFPYTPDYIVYPPISLKDRILRGPNHAVLLARYFWSENIPVICPFYKKFFSKHQSWRGKKERNEVLGEYIFKNKFTKNVKNKKILLLDDIITTGYTAHTLWCLLKEAWAKEIVGYFLASEKLEK